MVTAEALLRANLSTAQIYLGTIPDSGTMKCSQHYRNSAKISGRFSAMRKSDLAGPCGCLRPCSQSCIVRELIPSRLANAA